MADSTYRLIIGTIVCVGILILQNYKLKYIRECYYAITTVIKHDFLIKKKKKNIGPPCGTDIVPSVYVKKT